MEEDLYGLLKISEEATQKEIRKAFHALARITHPDATKRPETGELFMRIQKAYEILADEEKKKAYDDKLKAKKLNKAKDIRMDQNRKRMKEDLIIKENKHAQMKEEKRRAAKAPKHSEEDTTWLKKDKPFRMPSASHPLPEDDTKQKTLLVKWSRTKQFMRDEIIETFKHFGDIDLVLLRDKEGRRNGRPSALVSFKLASSAHEAIYSTVDFKVRWFSKTEPTTPSPAQQPFAFSPAGSPFLYSHTQNRTVEELEDFEMKILSKMKAAATASATPTPPDLRSHQHTNTNYEYIASVL